MSLKAIFFPVGCLIAWLILLPSLVIGGGLALFVYAVFAEVGEFLIGSRGQTVDTTAAREMARRMCGGYSVPARNARPLPLL